MSETKSPEERGAAVSAIARDTLSKLATMTDLLHESARTLRARRDATAQQVALAFEFALKTDPGRFFVDPETKSMMHRMIEAARRLHLLNDPRMLEQLLRMQPRAPRPSAAPPAPEAEAVPPTMAEAER